MVAGLLVLLIFLAETFVTGYCLARMRSLRDEVEVLRAFCTTSGVSGGPTVADVAASAPATEAGV